MFVKNIAKRIRKVLREIRAGITAGINWKICILPELAPGVPAHYIAVVAMIKNEGPYLQEWLDFHFALGVDHVYLYDNSSGDNTRQVCEPYRLDGRVTLIPWANFSIWFNQQRGAYAHALTNFGSSTIWMGFFDADEFMFPVTAPSLKVVLQAREHLPVLLVTGVNFGTSGRYSRPHDGVIASYRMGVPMPVQRQHRTLMNTKCFVRPQQIEAVVSLHWFRIKGTAAVGYTEQGEPIHGRPCDNPDRLSADEIRYNHYFTRSQEEFEQKLSKPDARGPLWTSARPGKRKMFKLIEALAQEDFTISRFQRPSPVATSTAGNAWDEPVEMPYRSRADSTASTAVSQFS